ncbi:MAG: GGDEF domain-containing phosphodiesterase [Oscillospiraceae bacterium]|nr:GGDEF domain-containing phosphodiesterase [Oscillospiraceae bacterium]
MSISTAAPSKDACKEALAGLLSSASSRKKASVFKLHLENFKLFNDTFGYHYGDMLIENIGAFLDGLSAEVFHYTGVDFIFFLENCSYTRALEIADEITSRFDSTWHINDMDCMCTINLGLLCPPLAEWPVDSVLACLESAVSEAAVKGQNQYALYNEKLQQKQYFESTIARCLKNSLAGDGADIEVRFRPTMCMEKGRYTRAECYLRLFTEDFGMLSAEQFMPVAEDAGLICAVDNLVIRRACELLQKLVEQKRDFETIAVPVSPVLFLQENFDQNLKNILDSYGVPTEKLALEVTESTLINSFTSINIMMQNLADLGIELILTDFGTGYSGINNILNLPVSALKLDRMFIWELETNPRSGVLIEGLVSIANKLGIKIIAEGVETENQKTKLEQFGCPYQQGFYYSATIEAEDLPGLFPAEG